MMIKKRKHQRGMSLISLLVALLIGTFLLAGLFDLWLQTKKTFTGQDQLAQVQENQRLATTLIANVVQTGGYFPVYRNYAPYTPPAIPYALDTYLPEVSATSSSPAFAAGQSIAGVTGGTAQGDQLYVRFVADNQNDSGSTTTVTLDCQGQSWPVGTAVTNFYYVDAAGNLDCSASGTSPAGTTVQHAALPIIVGTVTGGVVTTGIASMSVLYGVDTQPTPPLPNSTTQYRAASAVTSAEWGDVTSVVVTLNFLNPLYGQSGQTKQYLPITRTIAVTQTAP
jgi:type IV pilus assembly protein PilW